MDLPVDDPIPSPIDPQPDQPADPGAPMRTQTIRF
jgi:hypothetical protein